MKALQEIRGREGGGGPCNIAHIPRFISIHHLHLWSSVQYSNYSTVAKGANHFRTRGRRVCDVDVAMAWMMDPKNKGRRDGNTPTRYEYGYGYGYGYYGDEVREVKMAGEEVEGRGTVVTVRSIVRK